MDGLTPPAGEVSRTDRGQLLLVSAVALAVLFVTLAVILTTAIHTETIATGASETDNERAVVTHQASVDRHAGESIERVNEADHDTYESLEADLRERIAAWNDLSSRHDGGAGAASNVSLVAVTEGTRIVHEDGAEDFTNATGEQSWTVADDVSATRDFRMTVTRQSLRAPGGKSCDESGDCFEVTIDDGTDTWTMAVSAAQNEVVVDVENTSGDHTTCSVANQSAEIDLLAGTIEDTPCPALRFVDDVESSYDIHYGNADNASGTYTLTVDRRLSESPAVGGSPSYEPVIDDATLAVSYRTPAVQYETERRVLPGDFDD